MFSLPTSWWPASLVLAAALAVSGCNRLQPGDCPADMVFIPKGRFVSGATADDIGVYKDWPDRWVLPRSRTKRSTNAFCIERNERADPQTGKPRILVSWEQSKARCAQYGRRLCSEDTCLRSRNSVLEAPSWHEAPRAPRPRSETLV